ncbi:MAG TPA: SDR family oxidoreductase [Allocoleopsis sp.]
MGKQQNRLQDKVVIVTGASSGIGQATALEFARQGAWVVLAARRVEALVTVQQEIEAGGGRAIVIPTDVAEADQVRSLADQVVAAFGRIDVLVNNAGMGAGGAYAEVSPTQISQVVQVNLLSAMLLTRAVLPVMLAQQQGVIISVGSVASQVAVDSIYSATKFGLRGFSQGLARQLRGTGVNSCLVLPGFIQTAMTTHLNAKLPPPTLVANTIVRLALQPRREVVVPRYYRLAIWVEQRFPGLVDRVISSKSS